jgi:hypothetical protein
LETLRWKASRRGSAVPARRAAASVRPTGVMPVGPR